MRLMEMFLSRRRLNHHRVFPQIVEAIINRLNRSTLMLSSVVELSCVRVDRSRRARRHPVC